MKKYKEVYYAIPCGCRGKHCPDWHISNVAQVQGVHFTKKQAEDVAKFMNGKASGKARIIIKNLLKEITNGNVTEMTYLAAEKFLDG